MPFGHLPPPFRFVGLAFDVSTDPPAEVGGVYEHLLYDAGDARSRTRCQRFLVRTDVAFTGDRNATFWRQAKSAMPWVRAVCPHCKLAAPLPFANALELTFAEARALRVDEPARDG